MDTTKLLQGAAQVAVFFVFVTAIVQVIKGISGSGFLSLFKNLFRTLWSNKIQLTEDELHTLSFIVALLCCYAFDFGVIGSIVQTGTKIRESLAGWIDYIGTASLVYMGADWVYQKFAAVVSQAKAAQEAAK